jgi:hypothetical protein
MLKIGKEYKLPATNYLCVCSSGLDDFAESMASGKWDEINKID